MSDTPPAVVPLQQSSVDCATFQLMSDLNEAFRHTCGISAAMLGHRRPPGDSLTSNMERFSQLVRAGRLKFHQPGLIGMDFGNQPSYSVSPYGFGAVSAKAPTVAPAKLVAKPIPATAFRRQRQAIGLFTPGG